MEEPIRVITATVIIVDPPAELSNNDIVRIVEAVIRNRFNKNNVASQDEVSVTLVPPKES